MKNILDYTLAQLSVEMESIGQKKFRAQQLFSWIYKKRVFDFEQMTDIAIDFRRHLQEHYEIKLPKLYLKQKSIDGTIKILVELSDGNRVETVLMRYDYGNSVCVTTQVGCNMGCSFCASGLLKKKRDLTTGEIIGQMLVMESLMEDERISHIVVMGIGEPFDNYTNLLNFLSLANDPKAFEIGARHITVSTCGIAPKIRAFAEEDLAINLAISLHAPNDTIRTSIMPINRAYPLKELLDAVRYYEETTGKRVTFEYIMISGVNDEIEHAQELAQLVKGFKSYVNLIPYNEVMENPFKRPTPDRIKRFQDYLVKAGVNVTVRKEFGHDIDAACGQLRAKDAKALGVLKS